MKSLWAFSLLVALGSLIANAQTIATPSMARRLPGAGDDIQDMFRLGVGNTVTKGFESDAPIKAKMPHGQKVHDWSFGHLYTEGARKNDEIAFLQGLLPDSARLLYIDRNQNYDFTDDGPPLRLAANRKGRPVDSVSYRLKSCRMPGAFVQQQLSALDVRDKGFRQNLESFIGKRAHHKRAPMELWLADKAYCYVEAPLSPTQSLYLMDNNQDGIFGNDKDDKAAIMAPGLAVVDINDWRSPTALEEGSVLKELAGPGWLRIEKLDTLTGKVTLAPSEPPTGKPYIGRPIPDFHVPTLADTSKLVDLNRLIQSADYTLLDIWGIWCKGCVLAFPVLDSLQRKYAGRLQIVGLSTAPTQDAAFLAKHAYSWQQLIFNGELNAYLNPRGFPTYLLFNREGLLQSGGLYLEEVKAILKK